MSFVRAISEVSWTTFPNELRSRTGESLPEPASLLAALLADQQDLSAVERFAQTHTHHGPPAQARYYSSLMPATPPGEGQQYAFEVDLDRCSGCKACVTACHSLNGLDEGEAWRSVGLLIGGNDALPVLQHVTTACHHCVDPACANACPVDAYRKDPLTGIVRHLDDQCFGCQYCTLACPYDVPKYHAGKGIVRKCDLCADRLAVGEAPACVQACPHEAIRVGVVDIAQTIADCESNAFLPGAPGPDYTLPTTVYKSNRPLPRNLLPADYYAVKPEHAHWPLVVMLVLTQLSVGAFLVEWLTHRLDGLSPSHSALSPLFALACGLLALGASLWHLGRPQFAYRAVIGLRHSWLSREILAFGVYAAAASAYALACWLVPHWLDRGPGVRSVLAGSVVAAGLVGVFCSVMIYHVVKRPFWHLARTLPKFLLTALVLGTAATLFTGAWSDLADSPNAVAARFRGPGRSLCQLWMVATAAKLTLESLVFAALRDRSLTPLRRSAWLMTDPLASITWGRFALGGFGGLVVPALLMTADVSTAPGLLLAGVSLGLLASLAGELSERYLFFAAVVAPKMPGGLTP